MMLEIAGLHRIFPVLKQFVEAEVDVIIVVAGMEGALAIYCIINS